MIHTPESLDHATNNFITEINKSNFEYEKKKADIIKERRSLKMEIESLLNH